MKRSRSRLRVLVFALAVAIGGDACGGGNGAPDDVAMSGDVPSDVGTDTAGPDATEDVPPADAPTGGCPPVGSLQWKAEPMTLVTLAEATTYCGDQGMRVPTLCELRSFLRGCPVTEATGSCGVTDTCTDFCPGDCTGCPRTLGPENGCYWAAGTQGACGFYWTSKLHGSQADYAWAIDFASAFPFSTKTNGKTNVRCVQ